MFFFIINKGRL